MSRSWAETFSVFLRLVGLLGDTLGEVAGRHKGRQKEVGTHVGVVIFGRHTQSVRRGRGSGSATRAEKNVFR